jgi:hypothetical protein
MIMTRTPPNPSRRRRGRLARAALSRRLGHGPGQGPACDAVRLPKRPQPLLETSLASEPVPRSFKGPMRRGYTITGRVTTRT